VDSAEVVKAAVEQLDGAKPKKGKKKPAKAEKDAWHYPTKIVRVRRVKTQMQGFGRLLTVEVKLPIAYVSQDQPHHGGAAVVEQAIWMPVTDYNGPTGTAMHEFCRAWWNANVEKKR
jgi:hypothetical protein